MSIRAQEFLNQIDELIRAGKANEARVIFLKAKDLKITRADRLSFAALAKRLNIPEVSIRILNPIIRPADKEISTASDKEKAEYAACLVMIGAHTEALTILSALDPKATPEVLLYECHAHFAQWNYAATLPLLEEYVKTPELTPQKHIVGLANFAAALVYERDPKASEILESLLEKARQNNYQLAESYALMLLSEKCVNEKDWAKGREALHKAHALIGNETSLDALFVRKWTAIIDLYSKDCDPNHSPLTKIKKEALAVKHWETLRNCDHHEAVRFQDREKFLKVYFGTPFETMKLRLRTEFGASEPLPASISWQLLGSAKTGSTTLDFLVNPNKRGFELKPGQALHRLFLALVEDFYKPHSLAHLHAEIYPKDYFNPHSSPLRVHQLMKRLRIAFNKKKIPVDIKCHQGFFFLEANAPLTIVVPEVRGGSNPLDQFIQELQNNFPSVPSFSAKEVASTSGRNIWAVIRLLKQAKSEGRILPSDKGKNTRYYLTPLLTQKKSA